MTDVVRALTDIVGEDRVSTAPEERYFYARDPGLRRLHAPDYVVVPRTVKEIQDVVRVAVRERIPVVPMGGGMALTGLVIPHQGGSFSI